MDNTKRIKIFPKIMLVFAPIVTMGLVVIIHICANAIVPYAGSDSKFSSEFNLIIENAYYQDFCYNDMGTMFYSVYYSEIAYSANPPAEPGLTEGISKDYVIEHGKTDDNMHTNYLNQMVEDIVMKLDHENMTISEVYRIKGPNKVLYVCDEYVIIFNGEENACQWIDYKTNEILYQRYMNLDLHSHKNYSCSYNDSEKTLTFIKHRFGSWEEICVVSTELETQLEFDNQENRAHF